MATLAKITKFPPLPIHSDTLFTRYPPLNYEKIIVFLAQLIMTKVCSYFWKLFNTFLLSRKLMRITTRNASRIVAPTIEMMAR